MTFATDRLKSAEPSVPKAAKRVSRFTFSPDTIVATLEQNIVGQEAVLSEMADLLYLLKADISIGQGPLAVSLFVGPTGVGKTEIVRLLAKAMHGSDDHFCRIDMNTLSQGHYAAALTGAPPGYVGSKEGYTLFDETLIKGSYSKPGIVLLDEIEKADRDVSRALMNVFDNGRLALAGGKGVLDFRNTLLFMTSNIGASEVEQHRTKRSWRWLPWRKSDDTQIIHRALRRQFDPEFINRIDRILAFERLSDDTLDALVALEQTKLQLRLKPKGVSLELSDSARRLVLKHIDHRYGARDLRRRFRQQLEVPLARAMIQHAEAHSFVARARADSIQVQVKN